MRYINLHLHYITLHYKYRYWNSAYYAKDYPGANTDSDHNPVVATDKCKTKLN